MDPVIASIIEALSNEVFAAEDCIESGAPKVTALEAKLGVDISAEQRDVAWELFQGMVDAAEAEREQLETEIALSELTEAELAAVITEAQAEIAALATDDGTPVEAASFEDGIRILVEKMYVKRLPLHVIGVGTFEIVEGEEITLPADAVDALRNSDITFKEV